MSDQQMKQEIVNALRALKDQNESLRIEAVKRLGEIGVAHPQIISRLQAVIANDSSPEVISAAKRSLGSLQQDSPEDRSQVDSLSTPSDEHISDTEETILELLQKQDKALENIHDLIVNSLETETKKEDGAHSRERYHIRSRIVDVDMPISSMVNLAFKWLIASIPVGIIVGFLLAGLQSCMY